MMLLQLMMIILEPVELILLSLILILLLSQLCNVVAVGVATNVVVVGVANNFIIDFTYVVVATLVVVSVCCA